MINIDIKQDWHVHTSYTDGQNSVDEMAKQAILNGINTICFTEHIRRKLDYNFKKYVMDIDNARKKYGKSICIILGIETQIESPSGTLSIPDKGIYNYHPVIMGVIHGVHNDYFERAKLLLNNSKVKIWGHPFRGCENLDPQKIASLMQLCKSNHKIFEINLKQHIHPLVIYWLNALNLPIVFGSDAHRVEELYNVMLNHKGFL